MSKKIRIILFFVLIALVVMWKIYYSSHPVVEAITSQEKAEKFYWTCPMHPQIHQDHPGECPICHMKLVKVNEQGKELKKGGTAGDSQLDSRSQVQATVEQLKLIGIQKYTVEKMTLSAKISVSGRILSSSSLAFQVYEQDLRYIHPGLKFKGSGSIYKEEEISGVIQSVDSIVDPTSRTIRVIGAVQHGAKGMLSETGFRGEIEIELKDKLMIPESAVLHSGEGDLIYFVNSENTLKAKTVQLGMKTEGFYEVVSGLKEGEVISSGPNFLIDSEAKIRGASDQKDH